jgi:hypothetical protein
MLEFGAGFADFISVFEPASETPHLSDVPRLERAWAKAHHAADAVAITPKSPDEIARSDLPDVGLVLHPSVRVL